MAEFEFAGMTFKGGKMFAVLTALSTLGGGLWAGFEFYKDYMDMKEIVQNIDIDAIAAENALVIQKIDESMIRIEEAIEYTRDIKNDLKDELLKMESTLDRLDAKVDEAVDKTKESIETFEEFGISAVHLEDQIERKRCGHLENKELISTDAMVKKIKECVAAKKDENFKIIARSDAKSVEGIDKMIERCKAYEDAGAEIIFPEALHDEKDFEKVRKELSCYLLANMTEFGKTKLFNYKELEKVGYNIVI